MSRRRNTRSNRGGCGRIPTFALVLVALSILGYALVGNRRVESMFGVDVERIFETYVTDYFDDGAGATSVESIMSAVTAAGWTPSGERGVVRKSDHRRYIRQYSKGERSVVVEVRSFDGVSAAKSHLETVEDAARHVRFGARVATVEPGTGSTPGDVASLLQHLRTYRDMIVDSRK